MGRFTSIGSCLKLGIQDEWLCLAPTLSAGPLYLLIARYLKVLKFSRSIKYRILQLLY